MATTDQIVSWIVGAGGIGAIGKFAVDWVRGRSDSKKGNVEGAVVLVDTASNYAASVVGRLDRVQAEFDLYRREQDSRFRALDRALRSHADWDDLVRRKLHELQADVPAPPPLFVEP